MGVYADCFLLYGVFAKNKEFVTDDCYDSEEEENQIVFSNRVLCKYNAEVVIEPYSGEWSFVGIKLFSNDIEEFIVNLEHARSDFKELFKETNLNLEDYEKPCCCFESYYS